METTLINKYKDRDPKATVEIIQNFFINRNFETKIEFLTENECSAWTCVIGLYIGNIKITSQNGKGTSKDFCLASGYAELYERFCSRLGLYNNPILSNKFIQFNKMQNNYYLNENEQVKSITSAFENKYYQNYFDSIFRNIDDKTQYLKTMFNSVIDVPYLNLLDETTEFFDPRIITFIMGSSGLSAGNSLEEALTQGISELFERYVTELVLKNTTKKYYYIDNNSLSSDMQEMIKKIELTGNSVKIFDLSYTFNLPVCMILLTNIYSYNFHINFGCAPIFNIAAERTLTEVYQNRSNFLDANYMMEQQPYESNPWYKNYLNSPSAIHRLNCLPEVFLFNIEQKTSYNKEVYLDNSKESYSNLEFLNYYKEIIKNNNLEMFYQDNSLDKNIYSVQIFCPGLNLKSYEGEYIKNLSLEDYNNTLKYFYNWLDLIKYVASTNNSKKDLVNLLNTFKQYNNKYNDTYFGMLVKSDWLIPFPETKGYLSFNLLDAILNDDVLLNSCLVKGTHLLYSQSARLFCTLYNFLKAKYPKKLIEKIFEHFNVIFSPDFYENGTQEWYLFYYIILVEFRNLFYSNIHDQYMLNNCN